MKARLRTSLLVLMITLQVCFYPVTTFADTGSTGAGSTPSSSDQSQSSAPQGPQNTTGPSQPSGADANTYHYNEATGLWENDYYTWNPTTHQTSPKTPQTYSYNPTTGHWDTTDYVYNPTSGAYVPQVVSTPNAPAGTQTTSTAAPTAQTTTPSGSNPSNTNASNGSYDLFYNNQISNTVNGIAQSGNASVQQNTLGGNALTGNAVNMATVLNLLQSSFGVQSGAISTFNANLTGNMLGDLQLDPTDLNSGTPLKLGQVAVAPELQVNSTANNQITNNINLASTSGNATVSQNTTGGDATTGNATALADVVNMINTAISTGQSFVGNLNIYGNLNGDILLPDVLQEKLLNASAPTTILNSSQIANPELLANITNNSAITNNTTLGADSGSATVDQNTSAGSATTGNASTNLTLLNLTGKQIIGKNSLLVFVNVMGKWVGAIMNAPTGTTSAVLGDGTAETQALAGDTTINSTTKNAITNNINVQANSGDASVTNNTTGGNATSGNAAAGVNLLNMSNSSLSLADWFGVLFINVFGSWTGSFGVNTAAGTLPDVSNTPSSTNANNDNIKAFVIHTNDDNTYQLVPVDPSTGNVQTADAQTQTQTPKVLGTSTKTPPTSPFSQSGANMRHFGMLSIISVAFGLLLLGAERVITIRSRRHEVSQAA